MKSIVTWLTTASVLATQKHDGVIFVSDESPAPPGFRLVSRADLEQRKGLKGRIISRMDKWGIVKIADGGKLDGRGHGRKIHDTHGPECCSQAAWIKQDQVRPLLIFETEQKRKLSVRTVQSDLITKATCKPFVWSAIAGSELARCVGEPLSTFSSLTSCTPNIWEKKFNFYEAQAELKRALVAAELSPYLASLKTFTDTLNDMVEKFSTFTLGNDTYGKCYLQQKRAEDDWPEPLDKSEYVKENLIGDFEGKISEKIDENLQKMSKSFAKCAPPKLGRRLNIFGSIMHGLSDAAKATKRAAEATARATKRAAEATARATKRAAEATARETKRAAEASAKAAKRAAEATALATKHAAEKAALATKHAAEAAAREAKKEALATKHAAEAAARAAEKAAIATKHRVEAAKKAAEAAALATKHAAEAYAKAAKRAAEAAALATKHAAEKAALATKHAAEAAAKAAEAAAREVEKVRLDDIKKAAEEAAKKAAAAAKKAAKKASRAVKKGGRAAIKVAEETAVGTAGIATNIAHGENVGDSFEKGGKDIGRAAKNAGEDIIEAGTSLAVGVILGNDAEKAALNAVKAAGRGVGHLAENTVDLTKKIAHGENIGDSVGDMALKTGRDMVATAVASAEFTLALDNAQNDLLIDVASLVPGEVGEFLVEEAERQKKFEESLIDKGINTAEGTTYALFDGDVEKAGHLAVMGAAGMSAAVITNQLGNERAIGKALKVMKLDPLASFFDKMADADKEKICTMLDQLKEIGTTLSSCAKSFKKNSPSKKSFGIRTILKIFGLVGPSTKGLAIVATEISEKMEC